MLLQSLLLSHHRRSCRFMRVASCLSHPSLRLPVLSLFSVRRVWLLLGYICICFLGRYLARWKSFSPSQTSSLPPRWPGEYIPTPLSLCLCLSLSLNQRKHCCVDSPSAFFKREPLGFARADFVVSWDQFLPPPMEHIVREASHSGTQQQTQRTRAASSCSGCLMVVPNTRCRRRMKEYLPLMVQGLQASASSGMSPNRQQQQQGSVYHSNENVGTGGVHYPIPPEGVQ